MAKTNVEKANGEVEKTEGSWVGELLWEEYKYRHELFWKSFYLWGGAVTAIFIAPFLKSELRGFSFGVFIFPAVGLILSIIGSWHLAAEYERLQIVNKAYNEKRGILNKPKWPYSEKRTWYQQAVSESIGKAITLLFVVGSSLFFILDVLFLFIVLKPDEWKVPFIIGASILGLTLLVFCIVISVRKRKHNKSIK